MKVLSLFDGMSCGQIALERAGIPVSKYYASEIDKYAIQIAKKNYPNMVHVGDVTKVVCSKPTGIDLVIGGSPCQGFSFAGKQLNFEDPRSKLFFEFVRILKEVKPKYFMLENVKMKKESQDIISQYLGVEPIFINSKLVSAQSRPRLYWTNIPGVTIPEDKGVVVKDILESSPDNTVFMSQSTIDRFKGYGVPLMDGTESKARCLGALEYLKNGKQGNYLCARQVGRRLNSEGKRDDYNKSIPIQQRIEINQNPSQTNCLSTVQKDNILVKELSKYRKFTPIECERLQTVPDNYTEGVSNSQRYKMLGNGWTVDVVAHIFKGLKQ